MSRYYDCVIMGAGPAAYGALCALRMNTDMTVLQMSGGIQREMNGSCWLDAGMSAPTFIRDSGLPRVRAFGMGGTTQLWHGGLFVPHSADAIVSDQNRFENGIQLLQPLKQVAALGSLVTRDTFFNSLHEITIRAGQIGRVSTHRREVLIPRNRRVLSKNDFNGIGAALRRHDLVPNTIVDVCEANGKLEILSIGQNGFETVTTGALVIAAGVLGSAVLVRRVVRAKIFHFSDHYHVFAGAVPYLDWNSLGLADVQTSSGIYRASAKFTVQISDGECVDVNFTGRRVANPDYPRSGRRFGEFVGINALPLHRKLKILIREPMTVAEMICYKWGIELPFDTCLVHATVAPRSMAGQITEEGVTLNLPRDKVVVAVGEAWKKLVSINNALRNSIAFEPVQIHDSVISGAQFVGSLAHTTQFSDHPVMRKCIIADCSRFSYTSVYNQGLVSLAAGYAATKEWEGQ